MTWDAWLAAIECHDLTYTMSDDSRAYKRGSQSFGIIKREANQFPLADIRRAWNAMCDRKSPTHGRMFYWSA